MKRNPILKNNKSLALLISNKINISTINDLWGRILMDKTTNIFGIVYSNHSQATKGRLNPMNEYVNFKGGLEG